MDRREERNELFEYFNAVDSPATSNVTLNNKSADEILSILVAKHANVPLEELRKELKITSTTTGDYLVMLLEHAYKELCLLIGVNNVGPLRAIIKDLVLEEACKLDPSTTLCFSIKKKPLVVDGTRSVLLKGGQATLKKVFAAWDRSICYAVKEFSLDRKETFEAIKVEVNTLRQLNHIHCAKILGSYFIMDTIYSFCIVMPWYDFSLENLYKKDHIPDVPPETLKEFNNENFAIKTIICLSNAVYYLHNIAKLKHLDLKPPNILFKKEQGEYVVKICDFGITSKLSKNSIIDKSFSLKSLYDTEFYQSPEQRDNQPYLRSADIFFLGVVFLELCVWASGISTKQLRGKYAFENSVAKECLRAPAICDAMLKNNFAIFRPLIKDMLLLEPLSRPSIAHICQELSKFGDTLSIKPHCSIIATPDVPEDKVRPVYCILEEDEEEAIPVLKELYNKNFYIDL